MALHVRQSITVGSVVNLLIHPVGAVIIGTLAGALSVVGYRYLSVKFLNYFPLQFDAINLTFLIPFLIYLRFSRKCSRRDASQVNNLRALI